MGIHYRPAVGKYYFDTDPLRKLDENGIIVSVQIPLYVYALCATRAVDYR